MGIDEGVINSMKCIKCGNDIPEGKKVLQILRDTCESANCRRKFASNRKKSPCNLDKKMITCRYHAIRCLQSNCS